MGSQAEPGNQGSCVLFSFPGSALSITHKVSRWTPSAARGKQLSNEGWPPLDALEGRTVNSHGFQPVGRSTHPIILYDPEGVDQS